MAIERVKDIKERIKAEEAERKRREEEMRNLFEKRLYDLEKLGFEKVKVYIKADDSFYDGFVIAENVVAVFNKKYFCLKTYYFDTSNIKQAILLQNGIADIYFDNPKPKNQTSMTIITTLEELNRFIDELLNRQ